MAIECGADMELIEMLVQNGADVNARDYTYETPLFAIGTTGRVEVLIYLLYVAKADPNIKNEENQNCLRVLVGRHSENLTLENKIACFRILYNFLNPQHNWHPKYRYLDVLDFGLISVGTTTSMLPYFRQNMIRVHVYNQNIVELIPTDTLSSEILYFMLENNSPEELNNETFKGYLLSLAQEIVMYHESDHFEALLEILRLCKSFVKNYTFVLTYLEYCFKNHVRNCLFLSKVAKLIEFVLRETEANLFQLVEYVPNLVCFKNFQDALDSEQFTSFTQTVLSRAVTLDILSLDGTGSMDHFFMFVPYFDQLKKIDKLQNTISCNANFMLYNSLKKICRDIIRKAVVEKYLRAIENVQSSPDKGMSIERNFIADINSLPMPQTLIKYLRFIE
jgi:hypothetical protein